MTNIPAYTPNLNEDTVSQLPALHLLQNMGYTYLSPEQALALRGGRKRDVLLEGVLMEWLRQNNTMHYKGQEYPISDGNLLAMVQALKALPIDGLVRTNEKIYDLLCLGKSVQQSIDGDTKSPTLKYIDWEHPQNNVYHVTEEFSVERSGSHETRRPDIVLFVNGIPLVVIECKAPGLKDPIQQAISQQIRNQKETDIPQLFVYSQLLLALSQNEARYATTGTPAKFWAVWREEGEAFAAEVQAAANQQLTQAQVQAVYASRNLLLDKVSPYAASLQRQVSTQDQCLYALCRPERLLELTYRFMIYDAGVKKVARYQQYFCVKKTMERLHQRANDQSRKGGVVWHTQGSGKSLTMVLLAKSIALDPDILDYKIVLVTDRVDLDDQIYKTFHHCGKQVEQATTGKHLLDMLSSSKQSIITTLIHKFDKALNKQHTRFEDENIFVLVDEGHRGQYGSFHAKMRNVLPRACYIGFTGTPVMKKDKDTIDRFGGLIDTYTIDKAVEDQAVVPLLYEGRHVEQSVNAFGIDNWFKRITANLSEEQANDLKKKFATSDQLNQTDQKIMAVAWDISEHFQNNWQGTGFKGQLVTPNKRCALLYKKYLDDFGMVSAEVLISGPDEREGEKDLYDENTQEVQRFWKGVLQKYGNEKNYNKQLINAFKHADEPEIIIVVDKLLTGFDAPRNTILYLTRKLKEHTLLQAIARVNRLHDGKEFGYILDYRGVLENLDDALDLYSALPEFESGELEHLLTDVSVEVSTLPQKHSILWETFKEIDNKQDEEAYQRYLADEEVRDRFYERLSAYARTLAIAMASEHFLAAASAQEIDRYRRDLKFFSKLRLAVRRRYAEVVDFSEYEPKIQKLLDTHVGTGEIEVITPLVNIFDADAFAEEVDKMSSTASKADTIAHRTARTIHERMNEDPVFFRRFSEMLKEAIQAFREERLNANAYLKQVQDIMNAVLHRTGDSIPSILTGHEIAKAYYGVLKETLSAFSIEDPQAADFALKIDEIIERLRIVNWAQDNDVQNKMRIEIEDQLFELKKTAQLDFGFDDIDEIIEQCLDIARVRHP